MLSNFLDNPKLFRHVLEDLPAGIYIVDGERRIRFWNHGAEHLTGYLAHEVVGHVLEDAVQACDRRGNSLSGEHCPVRMTLSQRQPQQCTAFYLHKNGHRTAVRIHTRPILEYGDSIGGATILFEEAFVRREESNAPVMYGCLDAITGIPSSRLTRAVLNECMAGMAESHTGFGLLRIRLLGLEEFCLKHGPQSVAPFMRTAAQTLRHSLDEENFLGCWENHEFLAVLNSESPAMAAMKADILWNLLRHSEVLWWGDRFLIDAEVAYTVATFGTGLESLLREMKLSHSSETSKAAAAGAVNNSGPSRG
jgi:PAS domain S-box-containing protein